MTAFWTETDRDFVSVSGADALTYLQGQISQDLRTLGDGESTYSFVLQPTGKIEALIRVARRSEVDFVLDTDHGYGEPLIARLNRFKIRVKVDIVPLAWRCICVRDLDEPLVGALPAWGSATAFDLVGDDPAAPPNVRHGSAAELERARVAAGWPAMGAEITDASIPAETGVVSESVNFTKGCYPGQELVERMDSRGSQAPRFVRGLRSSTVVAVGDAVVADRGEVGHITSVAAPCNVDGVESTDSADWLALAVIARAVAIGAVVHVGGNDVVIYAARAGS